MGSLAVLAKNLEAIKLLVEHGVDQTIVNLAYDATPWTYAESNGFKEALKILTPPCEIRINNDKAELEEILTDVIELDKIKDPVIPANCGHTFDRASLTQHYNSGRPSSHDCPTCREPMKEPEKWTTNIMVSQILGMGMWKRRLNHQLQYQSGENQLRK